MLDVVWTCDDVGTEESAMHVVRLSQMLERSGFMGVFFVVPNFYGKPLHEKTALCRALEQALRGGHELALHGYDHYNFEFGIMPDFLLARDADARKELRDNRETIDARHTASALSRRLEMALALWDKAIAVPPSTFRSPCGSVHEHLFPALRDHGLRCDSSFIVNQTLWRYMDARVPLPMSWSSPRGPVPYEIVPRVWEFPLLGEYTLQIKESEIPYLRSVLEEDARRCEELGAPFVVAAHWWALESHDGAGYRFWQEQCDRWARRGDVKSHTLSQLCMRYAAGGGAADP